MYANYFMQTKSCEFELGTLVSSTNKTDHNDRTEILLKVALNTINQPSFMQNN
jgi:hypothetical protein